MWYQKDRYKREEWKKQVDRSTNPDEGGNYLDSN